jgi:hypothetical protein
MRAARLAALALPMALALGAGCRLERDPKIEEHTARARADIARLRGQTEAWVRANGRCPAAGEVERLSDPWGRVYVVLCPGQNGHAVDVVSKGRDGDVGTTDDVRSWD